MKKELLFLLLSFISLSGNQHFVKANDNYSSDGDSFVLKDKEYNVEESFCYTVTVNFSSGQAAGLVFGAKEDNYYWVFNIDRYENQVKLLYFYKDEETIKANVIYSDYYIGNDKMTNEEKELVNPKVKEIDKVQLKVIISSENDGIHAEFYSDNIKRFGVDNDIILNDDYQGGYIGYNMFNSNVYFTNVEYGHTDYSYYTELYRQQYHFSQYAHWNNDPNGLVYYEGYYHVYYQTHPFSKGWSDMYWGHARSKDLINWELLPICLFPETETEFGLGNGYMWSGSAMVYHKGINSEIDSWFTKDSGLLAFYTRDGARQDQVIMSSDDSGMTWTKRKKISQDLVGVSDRKIDCRDPKVFPVLKNGDKVTLWGMTLSNMNDNKYYVLKSENLLDWSYAGTYNIFRPECIDVFNLIADDNTSHTVFTFEGREYIIGSISYDSINGLIIFKDLNGRDLSTFSNIDEIPSQTMDYGPDSYATQSFFIDDEESEYFGKVISMSWFSGVPGGAKSVDSILFSNVREPWNGGGLTIPVEYGLIKDNSNYHLTETPITKNNNNLIKNKIELSSEENILANVDTHLLEIDAKFNVQDMYFRINMSDEEYLEIGYSSSDGYYVDRTNTSSAGINFTYDGKDNYHMKYSTGPISQNELTFYILSDNGGVEVFCDNFRYSFYVLTLSSPYSTEAMLSVNEYKTLEVYQIQSVWRKNNNSNEGLIYSNYDSLELDLSLSKEKQLIAYSTLNGEVDFDVLEGNDVISLTKLKPNTYKVNSLKQGKALIRLSLKEAKKEISVNVHGGVNNSDIEFKKVISGNWYQTNDGIVGEQQSGDGFLLSDTSLNNFYYHSNISLGNGAAAALVFRAKLDMSQYLIANYDNNSKIVKLWSNVREIARANVGDINIDDIDFYVKANQKNIKVYLNNVLVIDASLNDDEPLDGYLGLNVCATRSVFKEITIQQENYEYLSNNLEITSISSQYIKNIYNVTLNNIIVDKEFYKNENRVITINENYFKTLTKIGVYKFKIVGEKTTFEINVNVKNLPQVSFTDLEIDDKCNLNLFIGNLEINHISINGSEIDSYSINNNYLTISYEYLTKIENEVKINDQKFIVTVNKRKTELNLKKDNTLVIVLSSIGGLVLICGVILTVLLVRRKKHVNNN